MFWLFQIIPYLNWYKRTSIPCESLHTYICLVPKIFKFFTMSPIKGEGKLIW